MGTLIIQSNSEDDCLANIESGIELDNRIDGPECPEKRDVSAAPNIPRLIRPQRKSKKQAEKVLMMVNAIEMRRNKLVNKSSTEWVNVSPASLCILTESFR